MIERPATKKVLRLGERYLPERELQAVPQLAKTGGYICTAAVP
jgi:hypothetical protein